MTATIKGLFKPMAAVLALLSAIIIVALPIKQLHAQDSAAPPQLENPVFEDAVAMPTPQRRSSFVRVQSDGAAVQLDVRQTTIANVLSALAAKFNFSYHSTIALDEELNVTYKGPLAQVISDVLEGYDYVIKHENSNLEVIIFEKVGGQADSSHLPSPSNEQSPASTTSYPRYTRARR